MEPTFVRADLPLLKRGTTAVMAGVQKALEIPGVVKIHIDARENRIKVWRLPTDDELEEQSTPLHDKLRTITLEELESGEEDTAMGTLFRMFEALDDSGCYPIFFVSGSGPLELRKWVPISRRAQSLLGAKLRFDSRIGEDVVILCGAKSRDAEVVDLEYGVKVTLP